MTNFSLTLTDLQNYFGETLYAESFTVRDNTAFFLLRNNATRQLTILTEPNNPVLDSFQGEAQEFRDGYVLYRCPASPENAKVLRATLLNLQPTQFGLTTSAGFGDRLGLATPGHVRALQTVLESAPGKTIAPIFAQQSIREMTRTNRTPIQVLDDATWGAFEAGWRGPVGADADHLKNRADIDVCTAAGFSFYTFDPGAAVDNLADSATPADILQKVMGLPWEVLNSSPADLRQRYVGQTVDLESHTLTLTEEEVLRAAVKYGGAVALVAQQSQYLASKGVPFEVEVSVDETETPTTHAEHFYIASELKRLGVQWVSLAPRYVGRFEKGVDYIGDLAELRTDLAGHAAIARALGPYKLSLHSGSDKFSVYPLIVEAARGQVHLKTAGTSYLEALRAIARVKPALFREIAELAIERYPTDRATYHVSAELAKVPSLSTVNDVALPDLLDQFDAREVLHVTFGSALAKFGDEIRATLQAHRLEHSQALVRHFIKHLQPFV
jgi:tagaturonate epimerase